MSIKARSRASAHYTSASASPGPAHDPSHELTLLRTIASDLRRLERSQSESQPAASKIQELVDRYPRFFRDEEPAEISDLNPSSIAKFEKDLEELDQLYSDDKKLLDVEKRTLEQTLENVRSVITATKSLGTVASTTGSIAVGSAVGTAANTATSSASASGHTASSPELKSRRRDEETKKRRGDDGLDTKPFKRGKSLVPPQGLVLGGQAAFRLRKNKAAEEEWIQCEITRVYGDGNRFEVRDPEPDENNNPGQLFKAGFKDLIPIPPESDIPNLTPYPVGAQVLARYPETTTFYRAEVTGTKRDGKCRLKFEGEEEEGKETEVERRLVLPIPAGK